MGKAQETMVGKEEGILIFLPRQNCSIATTTLYLLYFSFQKFQKPEILTVILQTPHFKNLEED